MCMQAEDERLLLLLKGVFAGNIFDLGAAKSAELYSKGGGAVNYRPLQLEVHCASE